MGNRFIIVFVIAGALCCAGSCKKSKDGLQSINPPGVMHGFFEAWKRKDWKGVYRLSHPAFIQYLRMQKLDPAIQRLSDEELFVHEFVRTQRLNPDKILKTYEILSISEYVSGATTLWADTLVNGKKKKIPLALDGLTLKVDLTRIQ